MENELLRYEVRHLRARLEAMGDKGAVHKDERNGGRDGKAPRPADAQRQQRNEQAYDDLLWLLRRLDHSPAGPVLRRMKGFQVLRDRYPVDPEN
jgi:regulator of replication initiation timing